jgi:hypothetical protein
VDLEVRNNNGPVTSSSRAVNATTITVSGTRTATTITSSIAGHPTSIPVCPIGNYTDPSTCYCGPQPTNVSSIVTTIVIPHPTTITLTIPVVTAYPTWNATIPSIPSSIPSSLLPNGTYPTMSASGIPFPAPTSTIAKNGATASTVTVHPTTRYSTITANASYPTVVANGTVPSPTSYPCAPVGTVYVFANGTSTYTVYPTATAYPSSSLGNITTVYASSFGNITTVYPSSLGNITTVYPSSLGNVAKRHHPTATAVPTVFASSSPGEVATITFDSPTTIYQGATTTVTISGTPTPITISACLPVSNITTITVPVPVGGTSTVNVPIPITVEPTSTVYASTIIVNGTATDVPVPEATSYAYPEGTTYA